MVESCFRHARGTARIQFADRSFVLPAADEYDLSLVMDHGRYLAKRYGGAKVQIGGRVWQIEGPAPAGTGEPGQHRLRA